MKNLKSEAESILNEILDVKRPELKKEANEDLAVFSLKRLSAKQVDVALQNSGYLDNRIKSVKFIAVTKTLGVPYFIYKCLFEHFGENDEGTVHVFLNPRTGTIDGEFGDA